MIFCLVAMEGISFLAVVEEMICLVEMVMID